MVNVNVLTNYTTLVGYLATRNMIVRLHVVIGTPLLVPAYSSSFPLVALNC